MLEDQRKDGRTEECATDLKVHSLDNKKENFVCGDFRLFLFLLFFLNFGMYNTVFT